MKSTTSRVSAALLAASLTFLTACSNADSETPSTTPQVTETESESPETTAAPRVPDQYDTSYKVADASTNKALTAKYGKNGMASAYDLTVKVTTENSFREDLVEPRTYTEQDFAAIDDYMTDSCRKGWQVKLKDSLSADPSDNSVISVQIIAFHNVSAPKLKFRESGPSVINKEINSVQFQDSTSARSGADALKVTTKVRADLRMTENGKPILQPLSKSVAYWLVKDSQGGWKIDGWRGSFTSADAYPDPAA